MLGSLITPTPMISCWHRQDGHPFRQTDLNLDIKSPAFQQQYDITVPDWLIDCELTESQFNYTADLNIFPPCINFFGKPHLDRVIVLSIRLESAQGLLSHPNFIEKSVKNIQQRFNGTPRAVDNMLPVAWIGYEQYDDRIYVNNNQISGHLRGLLSRRQTTEIHRLLLDFLENTLNQSIRVAHHDSLRCWIQQNGRPGQRFMEFPYTSRVMRGWIRIQEQGWQWWARPTVR